jgi:hypothetical protein
VRIVVESGERWQTKWSKWKWRGKRKHGNRLTVGMRQKGEGFVEIPGFEFARGLGDNA